MTAKKALIVLTDAALALIFLPFELLALLAPVVCLFARWDNERTTFTGGAGGYSMNVEVSP